MEESGEIGCRVTLQLGSYLAIQVHHTVQSVHVDEVWGEQLGVLLQPRADLVADLVIPGATVITAFLVDAIGRAPGQHGSREAECRCGEP